MNLEHNFLVGRIETDFSNFLVCWTEPETKKLLCRCSGSCRIAIYQLHQIIILMDAMQFGKMHA